MLLTFSWFHVTETVSYQSFLLTERINGFQVGVTVEGVRVHAVLEGLHLLNDFFQSRVFDAHVIYRVEKRNAIWETFLHLLRTKCVEGNNLDSDFR